MLADSHGYLDHPSASCVDTSIFLHQDAEPTVASIGRCFVHQRQGRHVPDFQTFVRRAVQMLVEVGQRTDGIFEVKGK